MKNFVIKVTEKEAPEVIETLVEKGYKNPHKYEGTVGGNAYYIIKDGVIVDCSENEREDAITFKDLKEKVSLADLKDLRKKLVLSLTKENWLKLNKALGYEITQQYYGEYLYCPCDRTYSSNSSATRLGSYEGYTKIDFEDIDFDFEEVIGYKSPTDLFGGEVKAGSLFVLIKGVTGVKEGMWYAHGGAANTTSYSRHLPKEIVETWEPVTKKEPEVLTIGSNNISVTIGEAIQFRGYTAAIEEVNILTNLYKSPKNTFKGYNLYINKDARFIRIGCEGENNLFSPNEIDLVISTYKKWNSK